MKVIGAIKDPFDSRDYVSSLAFKGGGAADDYSNLPGPKSYDLRDYLPPVVDQRLMSGAMNSCGGQVLAYYLYLLTKIKHGVSELFDPIFPWQNSLWLNGDNGDKPTYMRSMMMAARMFGNLPKKYIQLGVNSFDPHARALHLASKFCINNYWRLNEPNIHGIPDTRNLINKMRAHISVKLPVAFGLYVNQAFQNYRQGVWNTDGQVLYGHFVLAVGYDDAQKAFLIINSWGTAWGMSGFGWIGYDTLLRSETFDRWIIADSNYISEAQPG